MITIGRYVIKPGNFFRGIAHSLDHFAFQTTGEASQDFLNNIGSLIGYCATRLMIDVSGYDERFPETHKRHFPEGSYPIFYTK